MEPADNEVDNSVSAEMEVSVGEVEQENIDGLKRKLEKVPQHNSELKAKVLKFGGYLLVNSNVMKAMSLHSELLNGQIRKLNAWNESLHVTKEEISSLPMNCLHLKQFSKAKKNLLSCLYFQYFGIAVHLECFFGSWFVHEVAEMQPLCLQLRRN